MQFCPITYTTESLRLITYLCARFFYNRFNGSVAFAIVLTRRAVVSSFTRFNFRSWIRKLTESKSTQRLLVSWHEKYLNLLRKESVESWLDLDRIVRYDAREVWVSFLNYRFPTSKTRCTGLLLEVFYLFRTRCTRILMLSDHPGVTFIGWKTLLTFEPNCSLKSK